MTDISDVLKGVNQSPSVKNVVFHKLRANGYYSGMPVAAAAHQFDAELAADNPRRAQILTAGMPYFCEYSSLSSKLAKSIACSLVGLVLTYAGVASHKKSPVLEMLGPMMAGGCGVMAAGYAMRRKFI